jgi:hypothetical protein
MDEKELMQQSEEIVMAMTKLVLGEKPGFLSNAAFKKLATHHNLPAMKAAYIDLIQEFNGTYNNAQELKKLTDFRYRIIELYNS